MEEEPITTNEEKFERFAKMYTQVERPKENKLRAIANAVTQKKSNGEQNFGFVDNRPVQGSGIMLETDVEYAIIQRAIHKWTEDPNEPTGGQKDWWYSSTTQKWYPKKETAERYDAPNVATKSSAKKDQGVPEKASKAVKKLDLRSEKAAIELWMSAVLTDNETESTTLEQTLAGSTELVMKNVTSTLNILREKGEWGRLKNILKRLGARSWFREIVNKLGKWDDWQQEQEKPKADDMGRSTVDKMRSASTKGGEYQAQNLIDGISSDEGLMSNDGLRGLYIDWALRECKELNWATLEEWRENVCPRHTVYRGLSLKAEEAKYIFENGMEPAAYRSAAKHESGDESIDDPIPFYHRYLNVLTWKEVAQHHTRDTLRIGDAGANETKNAYLGRSDEEARAVGEYQANKARSADPFQSVTGVKEIAAGIATDDDFTGKTGDGRAVYIFTLSIPAINIINPQSYQGEDPEPLVPETQITQAGQVRKMVQAKGQIDKMDKLIEGLIYGRIDKRYITKYELVSEVPEYKGHGKQPKVEAIDTAVMPNVTHPAMEHDEARVETKTVVHEAVIKESVFKKIATIDLRIDDIKQNLRETSTQNAKWLSQLQLYLTVKDAICHVPEVDEISESYVSDRVKALEQIMTKFTVDKEMEKYISGLITILKTRKPAD